VREMHAAKAHGFQLHGFETLKPNDSLRDGV
jgi:hypothetical protein